MNPPFCLTAGETRVDIGIVPGTVGAIILAAGRGKRMKSPLAKVLHAVRGKPMVQYVVEAAVAVSGDAVVVVVGHQAEEVRRVVSRVAPVRFALQEEPLGTGHAVRCALPVVPAACESLLVLCGDVPLIAPGTLSALAEDHRRAKRDVTVLAVDLEQPAGYGRLIFDAAGGLRAIVEEADADSVQRAVRTVNSGIYCLRKPFLETALPRLSRDNAQGEYYLTEVVRIGVEGGFRVGVFRGGDPEEVLGINSPADLERIERLLALRGAPGVRRPA